MTTVIPEGYSNGHIRFTLVGDTAEMTTAIGFESHPTMTAVEEANEFEDVFHANALSTSIAINTGYVYAGVRVERMTTTGVIVTEVNAATVGSGPATSLPSNCSLLVDKHTSLGGRKYRGRMYFPPVYVSEAIVDNNGYIDSGTVATLNGALESWRSGMFDAALPPRLLHSNPADAPTVITQLVMQPQIATQRERMR